MITLSSKNYKKNDYLEFIEILEVDLGWIIYCAHYGTNYCKSCHTFQCCRDIHYLYSLLKEKTK